MAVGMVVVSGSDEPGVVMKLDETGVVVVRRCDGQMDVQAGSSR